MIFFELVKLVIKHIIVSKFFKIYINLFGIESKEILIIDLNPI